MTVTAKEQRLLDASDVTARQLHQALQIVAREVGDDRAATDGALVGAVLLALSEHYRQAAK